MAIDFPASPTNGQTFTSGSVTYTWDGTKWTAVAAAGSSNSISQGNTNATVTDTGSDGRFVVTTEGTERLRVDSSGRLGVGTASPGGVLEAGAVSGSVTSGDLLVTTGSTTARVTVGRLSGTSNDNTSFRVRNRVDSTLFQVDSTAVTFGPTGTEAARIDSSGRLLVGTSTAPTGTLSQYSKFSVYLNNQSTSAGGQLNLVGGARGDLNVGNALGQLIFTDSTNGEYGLIKCEVDATQGTNDYPGRLVFSTTADGASSPTERMRIAANGETTFSATVNTILGLKIGEASGWGGNPAIHTSSNVGYIIIRNGTSGGVGLSGGGTSWSSLSDENYKTDLTPITNAAAKVRSLRTVTGRYIDDNEATSRSFLIAQDVEAVLPEAVSTADSGQKLLSYTDTIPLLTAALKEALEKIETLEAKVAALEAS